MRATKILMIVSAAWMAVLGFVATFAPEVVLRTLHAEGDLTVMLLVQLLGALYLGFAALNWMGRNNLIGGIYSRPVAVANLMHFMVAGIAMIKHVAGGTAPVSLVVLAVVYATFAVAFGVVMRRHPIAA